MDLQRGAKITSLRDQSGDEWLLPPRPLPVPPPPGLPFTAAEMGGWDECAPTIDATRDPAGRPVPDHGDVWDARWHGTAARHSVRGRTLPYRLTRTITPLPAGLRFDYEVVSDADMPFLWAAHPQFRAPAGTRVVVPHIATAVDTLTDPHAARPWPRGIDRIDDVSPGHCRKLYADPAVAVHRAELVVPGRALRLSMEWDAAVAPYLGLWFDHAAVAREPVIALEPATGFFDSLSRAVANDRVLWLRAGSPVRWHLAATIG